MRDMRLCSISHDFHIVVRSMTHAIRQSSPFLGTRVRSLLQEACRLLEPEPPRGIRRMKVPIRRIAFVEK